MKGLHTLKTTLGLFSSLCIEQLALSSVAAVVDIDVVGPGSGEA